MKATGVIHLIAELQAFPEYAPGTVLCERMDGKGMQELAFTKTSEGYVLTIPLTDHNIEIAKAFWMKRFRKVLVDHQPIEIPFKQEEYDAWFEDDKKILAGKAKELAKVEADLKKHQATLPGIISAMEAKHSEQAAKEFEAHHAKRPKPEVSKAYTEALDAVNAAREKEQELQNKIAQIKGEMQ